MVTAENWGSPLRHVVEVEAKFKGDSATSASIQPIVIRLDEDGTASESNLSGIEPLELPVSQRRSNAKRLAIGSLSALSRANKKSETKTER